MLGKPTIIFYEHGINSVPSSWRDWVNRAIAFTHLRTPHKAQTLAYFTTALTVFWRESERSKAFGKMLRLVFRQRLEQSLNCLVTVTERGSSLRGMRLAWLIPRIQAVHLVCGACGLPTFETNGINAAHCAKPALKKFSFMPVAKTGR